MAGKLEGKVAVVTGSIAGISLATAKQFRRRRRLRWSSPAADRRRLDKAVAGIGREVIGVRRMSPTCSRPGPALRQGQGGVRAGRRLVRHTQAARSSPRSARSPRNTSTASSASTSRALLFTVQKACALFTDGGSIILNASIVSIKGMPAFSVTREPGRAVVRPHLDGGPETRKIRVNAVSLADRGARGRRPGRFEGGGRPVEGRPRQPGSARSDGRCGRDRKGCRLPGLRRQQLCHRASSCSSTAGWPRSD